jgi:hypothetical protein
MTVDDNIAEIMQSAKDTFVGPGGSCFTFLRIWKKVDVYLIEFRYENHNHSFVTDPSFICCFFWKDNGLGSSLARWGLRSMSFSDLDSFGWLQAYYSAPIWKLGGLTEQQSENLSQCTCSSFDLFNMGCPSSRGKSCRSRR